MDLFNKTRLTIGKSVTRRRVNKRYRNKKFNNLRNSHKIGLVWDGSMTEEFHHIKKLHHSLQEKDIQLDVICYYQGKVLPDEYTALRYLTCFKKSELTYFYIPDIDSLKEFVNTPYEILIDINFNNHFPLYYITALSNAEFKIGAGGTINNNALDMTIETGENRDVAFYLNQVEHYLNMINTGV